MVSRILSSKWTKVVLFILCLVPAGYLGWALWETTQTLDPKYLTANPIQYITHFTGDWTLQFLLLTLAITPLRNILNQPKLTRFRRMLGLFAFFYVCLHLTTWIWLDKMFVIADLWADVIKRWYITLGMAAVLGLIPLAITSTAGWVRRLGYKRWQKLHRIVYVCVTLGVIHFYMSVKSDVRKPLLYGAIAAVLLGYRVRAAMKKPSRPAPPPKRTPAAV
jgi:sulfoxide reductase heme-binding subunit YedZ